MHRLKTYEYRKTSWSWFAKFFEPIENVIIRVVFAIQTSSYLRSVVKRDVVCVSRLLVWPARLCTQFQNCQKCEFQFPVCVLSYVQNATHRKRTHILCRVTDPDPCLAAARPLWTASLQIHAMTRDRLHSAILFFCLNYRRWWMACSTTRLSCRPVRVEAGLRHLTMFRIRPCFLGMVFRGWCFARLQAGSWHLVKPQACCRATPRCFRLLPRYCRVPRSQAWRWHLGKT